MSSTVMPKEDVARYEAMMAVARREVNAVADHLKVSVYQNASDWCRRFSEARVAGIGTVFLDGYAGANMLGSGQVPLGSMVDSLLSSDSINSFKSYLEMNEQLNEHPDMMYAAVPCPPKGEVDVLIVGDSSIALVSNPFNPDARQRLSWGDLLQGTKIEGVREVHHKMTWGKGLVQILEAIRQKKAEVELHHRANGTPPRKWLVLVGWAGNDVHGDSGYQGCEWTHKPCWNRTEADRKVAADYAKRRYDLVECSINEFLDFKDEDDSILDFLFIGNAEAKRYKLPASYNCAMGQWFSRLSQGGIQCICSDVIASNCSKYDQYHLVDDPFNRSTVIRAVSSMIKFHLAALDIMSVGAQVKVEAEKMASPDILKAGVETWPHLLSFKVALQETRVVQEFLRQSRAPVTTPATLNQACQEADEEIMQWCAAAVDDAEDNATREGRPVGQDFTREETTSMMPIDVVDNDSEDEEARIRMHIQKDLDEAVEAGFSTVQDDEFEVIEKDIPEKGGWTEAEKTRPGILNPFDESEKPFTIIDDEGKEVARDEESNEPIGEEVDFGGSDVEVIEAKRAERPAAGSTEVSPPLMKSAAKAHAVKKMPHQSRRSTR